MILTNPTSMPRLKFLRPKARQTRESVDWDMPSDLAIDLVDQCVSPPGGSCSKVAVIIFSTCSSVTVLGRPGHCSSFSPCSLPLSHDRRAPGGMTPKHRRSRNTQPSSSARSLMLALFQRLRMSTSALER
jgi:hypothetical protein